MIWWLVPASVTLVVFVWAMIEVWATLTNELSNADKVIAYVIIASASIHIVTISWLVWALLMLL